MELLWVDLPGAPIMWTEVPAVLTRMEEYTMPFVGLVVGIILVSLQHLAVGHPKTPAQTVIWPFLNLN
jgi:hypothetical protein